METSKYAPHSLQTMMNLLYFVFGYHIITNFPSYVVLLSTLYNHKKKTLCVFSFGLFNCVFSERAMRVHMGVSKFSR